MGEVIRIFFFTLLFLFSYTNAAHSAEESSPPVCKEEGKEAECEAAKKKIEDKAKKEQANAVANAKKEQEKEQENDPPKSLDEAGKKMEEHTAALTKKLQDEKKKCEDEKKRLGLKDKDCSKATLEQSDKAKKDLKAVEDQNKKVKKFCKDAYGVEDCKVPFDPNYKKESWLDKQDTQKPRLPIYDKDTREQLERAIAEAEKEEAAKKPIVLNPDYKENSIFGETPKSQLPIIDPETRDYLQQSIDASNEQQNVHTVIKGGIDFNDIPQDQFGGGTLSDEEALQRVKAFEGSFDNPVVLDDNPSGTTEKPFEPDYNLTEREGFKPVQPLQEVADGNAKGPPVPLPVKKPDTTVTPTKVVTDPINNGGGGVASGNDPKNNNGNVAQNGGVNAGQQNGGGAQNNNTGGNGQQGNAGLGGGGFNNGGNNGAVNTALNNQNSSLNNLNQKIGNFKSQNSVDGTSSRKQKTSQKRQPVLSQRQNDPESEQPEDNVDRAQRSRDGKSSRDRRVASLDPGALKRGYGSAGKASVNPDEEEEAGLSAEEEANEKMKANEGFISAGLSKLKSLFSSRKRSWGEKASIYGSKNKKKKKKVSSSDLDSARAILNRKLQEGQGKILGVRGIVSTQTGITGSDMSIFKSMCLSYHNYQVNNDIHMGQTWCPKK